MRYRTQLLPLTVVLAASLLVGPIGTSSAEGSFPSHDEFFELVRSLCGETFEGYSSYPPDPDHDFAGRRLVASISTCTEQEIRIPFSVGEDQSRTWLITRNAEGMRLQHDHRHEDGSPHEVNFYGGWAGDGGSATTQSFAADQHTATVIPEASTNVWTLTLDPAERSLTYFLTRHSKPRFKAVLKQILKPTGEARSER